MKQVLFLVVPRFNLMSFTAGIEPLRVANRLAEDELYSWSVVSTDRSPVASSDGITIVPDYDLKSAPQADAVFVCASFDAQNYDQPAISHFLRRQVRFGATIGSIGTGSFILAQAGLLDGYRCTIHWENKPAFLEMFPHLDVNSNIYEIDRDRVSCGGGMAALDMMLHLIAFDHNVDLVVSISSQLLHDRLRTPQDHQRMADKMRLGRTSPRLASAIQLMEVHIEAPLPITEISDRVAMTQRQLERLFQQHCGTTPHEYYLDIRLQHARNLLLESKLSILNVALASGFASQPHFTDRYRKRYGLTPSEQRKVALEPST
jgi:transcriptional regulator GlxA family with amidase domain